MTDLQKAITHFDEEYKSMLFICKFDKNKLHLRCWSSPQAKKHQFSRKQIQKEWQISYTEMHTTLRELSVRATCSE